MTQIEKYSELKLQIAKLTAEAKEIEPEVSEEIVALLEESGEKTYANDFGKFALRASKTTTYSADYIKREEEVAKEVEPIKEEIKPLQEKIETLNKELSDLAKEEVKTGKAKVEITKQSAVFTANK